MAVVRDVDVAPEALVVAAGAMSTAAKWAAVIGHRTELEMLAADRINDMTEVADRYPAETQLARPGPGVEEGIPGLVQLAGSPHRVALKASLSLAGTGADTRH